MNYIPEIALIIGCPFALYFYHVALKFLRHSDSELRNMIGYKDTSKLEPLFNRKKVMK